MREVYTCVKYIFQMRFWTNCQTLIRILRYDPKLSKDAARKRSDDMRKFVRSLEAEADYALCRFKRWRVLGYRCAAFDKMWVFAYEIFDQGIIIRDMDNVALLRAWRLFIIR
ncbi:hypothetical protein FACS1894159_10830 [Bacteroidia bacterium]|nr:hypothetical protein FACS1894159_10830 [Bacteroidia bacterium]